MIASQFGHTATVQVLVDAGADKEAKDNVRERVREAYQH
jgi:hypothetical protein